MRIPSISADPDRRADVQAERRGDRRAPARARPRVGAARRRRRLASLRDRRVDARGRGRADCPSLCAPRRAAARHRRELGERPVRARPSAAVVSTAAGSADDKAGGVAHAHAVSAWLDTSGALPCNVRVLIEGEEEIGSPTLHAFLDAHVDELRSDVLVLADAGNWKVGVPGLTYSLRGLAAADIELRALDGPVHSGMAGGAIPDPVMALARVLASLVDEHGDVAIDGLWDDVRPPTARGTGADRRPRRRPRRIRPRDGRPPGRAARRRPRHDAARAAVVPAVADRHRDRRPPDQGLVEPDHRPRRRRA